MLLLSSLFTKFKKNILQLLLIFAVFYWLQWYYENSQQEIKDATEKVETLEGDNKKLVDEVKDLKEQSPDRHQDCERPSKGTGKPGVGSNSRNRKGAT